MKESKRPRGGDSSVFFFSFESVLPQTLVSKIKKYVILGNVFKMHN